MEPDARVRHVSGNKKLKICRLCKKPIGKWSYIFEVVNRVALWYEHAYCRMKENENARNVGTKGR